MINYITFSINPYLSHEHYIYIYIYHVHDTNMDYKYESVFVRCMNLELLIKSILKVANTY